MPETILAFEDFEIGREFNSDERTISAEEIIEFASEFDPQPMHLNEAAGKASILGGLSASGWHISAMFMRLFCDTVLCRSTCEGSPGVDYMEWRRPVLAGDTIKLLSVVTASRPLNSRPGVGIVTFEHIVTNQRDELVAKLLNPALMRMRSADVMS